MCTMMKVFRQVHNTFVVRVHYCSVVFDCVVVLSNLLLEVGLRLRIVAAVTSSGVGCSCWKNRALWDVDGM